MEIRDTKKVTQAQIAELFGVSGPAIRKWETDAGCPRNRDRSYDLGAVIAWRVTLESGRATDSIEANGDAADALERWRSARAGIAEIDFAERKRSVIPAHEVRRVVTGMVSVFKAQLFAQPGKLAATLAALDRPEDCQAELDRENRELLADIQQGVSDLIHGDTPATADEGDTDHG